MSKTHYVYIMASAKNGTLYIGVTNDIGRRAAEHREGLVSGLTKKHAIKKLIYFESFADIGLAIGRQTRLKKWKRRWKMELIETANPAWNDLFETFTG